MIGLIDYGGGNLASVGNALDLLGAHWRHVRSSPDLAGLGAVIFPGVGAAGPAMRQLQASGLDRGLLEFLKSGRAYLGICLGMQLLFEASAEDGSRCLGYLAGQVVRMPTSEKLPHVGWNTVELARPTALFTGLQSSYFYFSHSYVVEPGTKELVSARTQHGGGFVSAIAQESVTGVQFHPERSGGNGIRLLRQFLALGANPSPAHAD